MSEQEKRNNYEAIKRYCLSRNYTKKQTLLFFKTLYSFAELEKSERRNGDGC